MKARWYELTDEQLDNFGDGCTFVPDFIFTASCRIHDFNYSRGGWLKDKIKADYDMCRLMLDDSYLWWHYVVTILYWLGLTLLPFPYLFFHWGNYLTIDQILLEDSLNKML